jgi:signal transduction histidine kinase/DNA-binding response OmpR family regulator
MTSAESPGVDFAGPGDVRARLRSLDWSRTGLGPPQSWSPVLRQMVDVCLESGFPILINWGPELVAIYNDAFARTLGGKHPGALGRSARDTWPESWDAIGHRLHEVIQDGTTLTWENERQILERNGYPEECFFTFSHSPIRELDGTIAGMFTASIETTAKMIGERRMRVVRQLGGMSVTDAGSTVDCCRAALNILRRTRESVPFAAAVLTADADSADAAVDDWEPVGGYGLAADADVSDFLRAVDSRDGVLQRVLKTADAEAVIGLRDQLPDVLPAGPLGPLRPDAAVVLPLTVSGRSEPIGALVLGVNPYRPLDDDFWAFGKLIGRQIRVALTDTIAYELERQRVQVLADLDRAKMEFFQNVSHELRTPLTLLLSPLRDLLQSPGRLTPAEEREDLEAAVRAAERLQLMVEALLDFSGAEARTLKPALQPTDLVALTGEVASMFRATAEHAGLRFEVAAPADPVTALVDRGMWSTIVTNLLSNAMKFTPSGGVEVALAAAGATVTLTVTDTGVGIPAAQQQLVFDRFYRATGGEQDHGAGIGLALVSDLARAHKGTVQLRSEPGSGSTFTVVLPTRIVGWAPGQEVVEPSNAEHSKQAWLIEDDADLRTYVTRLLTDNEWTTRVFGDAESAIEALTSGTVDPPDLVVTDVMLPGRSGLDLVRELRAQEHVARVPVIVLTARSGTDATAEGFEAGADDYVTKPFSAQELLSRVQANYGLQRFREEAVDAAETRADQIRQALDSNRMIGTAVGILMAGYRLSAADAFQLLVASSQQVNLKLRELSNQVVETGKLPFRPTIIDDLVIRVSGRSNGRSRTDKAR